MKPLTSSLRNVAFAAFLLVSFSASSIAASSAKSKATYDLNFVGSIQSFPVFQLTIDNTEDAEFEIRIVDIKQEVLYNDVLKGNIIVKKYGLDVEAHELNNIRFIVTNRRTNETKTFQVVNNTYVIDNVSVSKL